MSTVSEIEQALPNLTTEELQRVETALHQQYRQRHQKTVYDDSHGTVLEADLVAEAEAAFLEYDREENAKTPAR